MQQGLKQQCAAEVAAVRQEVEHRQRQAARTLKAQAEEEAIKVGMAVPLLFLSSDQTKEAKNG